MKKKSKYGRRDREQGHVTYLFKYWKTSKTVSQTIKKNCKHCAPNVQSYAIAGVRKPSGLESVLLDN